MSGENDPKPSDPARQLVVANESYPCCGYVSNSKERSPGDSTSKPGEYRAFTDRCEGPVFEALFDNKGGCEVIDIDVAPSFAGKLGYKDLREGDDLGGICLYNCRVGGVDSYELAFCDPVKAREQVDRQPEDRERRCKAGEARADQKLLNTIRALKVSMGWDRKDREKEEVAKEPPKQVTWTWTIVLSIVMVALGVLSIMGAI